MEFSVDFSFSSHHPIHSNSLFLFPAVTKYLSLQLCEKIYHLKRSINRYHFRIDDMEYFGVETFTMNHNSKPISYKHKLYREMKNQLDRLLKKLKFTNETIKKVKALFRTEYLMEVIIENLVSKF